jgi:KipI family sensor histidine kinase inhibitor
VRIDSCGDSALLVTFADAASAALSQRIARLHQRLSAPGSRPTGLLETVPGFTTLLLVFDPDVTDARTLDAAVTALAGTPGAPAAPRVWTVPVCYERELGPDLEDVAQRCGLAVDEVVALHASRDYTVHLLGFSPGFPYLGELDPALALPRRTDPRARVPAGAVAIATRHTAIYPQETPGGWHLIGRTPLALFDPSRTPPALFAPGDTVRFEPVTRDAYDALAAAKTSR